MRILVTGGCGFIGSSFVRRALAKHRDITVRVLDLLTYAGNPANLADVLHDPRLSLERGDIADADAVARAASGVDAIINFAAETHVDRSIHDAAPFVRTNVIGTQVLLDTVRNGRIARFLQVSTDEVYGSIAPGTRSSESHPLSPTNPYSASKAAADLLVHACVSTYGVPALIVRSSNAYGPYQFPEKLIPLTIANAFAGESVPLYGDGGHTRDWIHVEDACAGIWRVLERGRVGEVYNIGAGNEVKNLALVRQLITLAGGSKSLIRFVADRPGHDRRYAMDCSKITNQLGWRPERPFADGLRDTVAWYAGHAGWVNEIRKDRAYRRYYELQYSARLSGTAQRRRALPAGAGARS